MASAIQKHRTVVILIFVLLLFAPRALRAQTYNFNYNLALSTPTFGTNEPVEMGFINVSNGNLHIEIPIASFPQRGNLRYAGKLVYDSRIWQPVYVYSTSWQPTNVGGTLGGWRFVTGGEPGTVGSTSTTRRCDDMVHSETNYAGFTWTDPYGNKHMFNVTTHRDPTNCDMGDTPVADGPAYDSSGYHIYLTNYTSAKVYAPDGSQVFPQVQDTNGNYFSLDANGNVIDTQGHTPITVTGTSPITYAVASPQGTANFVATTATQTYHTAFGQSGITEASGTLTAITQLSLPDGSSYLFTYDSGSGSGNYAELTSMRLPTGATIQFNYANFQDAFGNVNRWINSRTVGGSTWFYTSSVVTSCTTSNCWQRVDVQKPDGGHAIYNFFLNNGAWVSNVQYSGTSTQNITIQNTYSTCGSCGPTSNIVKQTQTTTLSPYPYVAGSDIVKSVTYTYSNPTNGLVGEIDESDYGAKGSGAVGAILRKTLITYAGLSGTNMSNKPYQVTVQNGSGVKVAQTTYAYDQAAVTASGASYLNAISGARGNPTSIAHWVSGSNSLTTLFAYLDTGSVSSSTDPNGTATTYSYAGTSCNSAFPTSVTVAGLTTQYAYNCSGGVVTSVTDPNNQTATTTYNDPYFWRPASTTDALQNQTLYAYSPTQTESALSFNGNTSTVDVLATIDTYGRPQLQQRRQSPGSSNFDTTELIYDGSGRVQWSLRPYVSTAGVASGGGLPATGYTYDALGRTTNITDWTGVQINNTYSLNDVKVTVVGQPSGENPKSRQYEYDGLGRLKSVCEITSVGGSVACSHNTGANGFFTSYTYDPLGNLTGVSQSGQTRSFTYDGLSRMLTETNPETSSNGSGGTTTYEYDIGYQCSSSNGNLMEVVNAVGQVTCYTWDGLHRLTGVTYPNASWMPSKTYIYDQGNYFGIAVNNPKGRMSAAYTYNGTYTSKTVMSYDALGRVTNQYQSAPHGGWYDVQQSYWPNGALHTLEAFNSNGTTNPFIQAFTTTADGEGRVSYIWEAGRGYVLSSVGFNPASQPTQLNVIGGQEAFQYDGNSGRMTQWSSTAGSNSQTGSLTWNPNGTLQTLSVTGQPTCNYSYDDLARLAGVNCGTGNWAQNFGYDVFGNTNKTGSISFSSQGGTGNHAPGLAYDGVGRVIADNLSNTFIYDMEGRAVSINSLGIVYDAFNRPVEMQSGGSYTQVVYSPTGEKFALMNGTTVQKYFIPLVAGVQAVYDSTELKYYRHADWLGSSRFGSTPAGGVQYSLAYAPFGETYSETGTVDRSYTGQTQDTVAGSTGHYDFLFRQQASSQGRWLVPDPAGLAAVDPTNPQTWNRYAYVANNPLSKIDLLGLDSGDDCGGPCQQFSGWDQFGCWVNISYSQQTYYFPDSGEYHTYDVPSEAVHCYWSPTTPIVASTGSAPQGGVAVSSGGGGTAGASLPVPVKLGTISNLGRLGCASSVADNEYSVAAHTSGTSPQNPIVKAFLGNSISGLYDIGSAPTLGAALTTAAVNGVNPGIPAGPEWLGGATGVSTQAIISTTMTNVTRVSAETVGKAVGTAKLAYDLSAFAYAYFVDCR